jgi:hypothetical protein
MTAKPRPAVCYRIPILESKTGLDPLDPASPLAPSYVLDIVQDIRPWDLAHIRFPSADGSSRLYGVPLGQREWALGGWRYTGLDRLIAPRTELAGLPLADASAALRIGTPRPLLAMDGIFRDGPSPVSQWVTGAWDSVLPFLWSPNGDAILVGRVHRTAPRG